MKLFSQLRSEIIHCRLCPRLVQHRENVPARACYAAESHWRKPVPGFGDEQAWLLIIGLAPSNDGGNRTGRIFTGDPSAVFLMKNLYEMGFANQPTSESVDDGLRLNGCYITASVKCVPPKHRPLPIEIQRCSRYLEREFALLKKLESVLVLGGVAFCAYVDFLGEKGLKFEHGMKWEFENAPKLYASYHPSPQNTNTGKLTSFDFQRVLKQIIIDRRSEKN